MIFKLYHTVNNSSNWNTEITHNTFTRRSKTHFSNPKSQSTNIYFTFSPFEFHKRKRENPTTISKRSKNWKSKYRVILICLQSSGNSHSTNVYFCRSVTVTFVSRQRVESRPIYAEKCRCTKTLTILSFPFTNMWVNMTVTEMTTRKIK